MIIQMNNFNGESITKVCKEDSWMVIIEKVAEGLGGFGYSIPKDREKFLAMLSEDMEANE